MTDTQPTAWPTERGRRPAVVAQFGNDRADLLHWALTTGDPLADAVVADIHGDRPDAQRAWRDGAQHGLAWLADPPESVVALLTSCEQAPDYVDDELLERGSAPFFTIPPPVHMVSLSAGALIRVYESPSIAAVLATTGRLVDGADRRIRETGKWVVSAMLPGSLRVGGAGYVATLQVRMLHAQMRRLVLQRGFDAAAYSVPINQVDLARTWMDFTVTSLRAEASMGFDLTSNERATLYRYWWYLGHLLGIDARLIEGIATDDQAARIDELLQAVTGPLIPESKALAAATVASIADELHAALKLPSTIGGAAMVVLARRFHGEAVANELGLARHGVAAAAVDKAVEVVRKKRWVARDDADAWAASCAANLDGARRQIETMGATQFETASA